MTMEVSLAEANLLKRVRQLAAGRHLTVLDKDAAGLATFSVMGTGKVEQLRQLEFPLPGLQI